MDTDNLPSSNDDDDADNNLQQKDTANGLSKERIFLTSRTTKKHVTIHEDFPLNPQALTDVEEAVQHLEKNFTAGIDELRYALSAFASDRKSFDLHVKTLEESVRKSNQEKEKYREIVHQMKGEMETLAAKLDAMEKLNEDLQGKNETLQSDHEDHMKTIADRHRKNLLAKKTFKKWRGKVKKKELSNSQVEKLVEENANLKKELLYYQESTKNAFLRSANVLNSEALSLFQNTTTRIVNISSAYNGSDDNESSSTETSSVSDKNSISSLNEFVASKGKENEKRSDRRRKEHLQHSLIEKIKKNMEYLSDEPKHDRRKYFDRLEKSHSDNELQTARNPRINEFVPDPLRRETRQIMKQLETNNKPFLNSEKDQICNSGTHLHICHCARLPGSRESCPYCYANQNFHFANMPIPFKPKPKENVRIIPKGPRISTDKAKVLYKPSGSTVVVEKHL